MTSKRELLSMSNPEPDKVSPITFSSQIEQEALWGAVVERLIISFKDEAEGFNGYQEDQKEHLRQENRILRKTAYQLSQNLGKPLTPIDGIALGISEVVPDEQLEKWAFPSEEPHWTEVGFHLRAKYLFDERQSQASSKE